MTLKQRRISVLALAALGSLLVAAGGKPKPATPTDGFDLTGQGSGSSFVLPDPKFPGKPQLQVWAKTFLGNTLSGGGYRGDFGGVTAKLFQRGVATAKLTAPRVKGNNFQNVLVASGRVTVISLIQSGTVLKADIIHWYPKTNLAVADGHVFYRDGKSGGIMRTSHMQANTALETISSGG